MVVDCQWVERNLEGLFCDALSQEDSHRARTHIENCLSCRNEVETLNAIDPLIRKYFRGEVARALSPRLLHKGRVFGISGAAATLAVLFFVLLVRTPTPRPPVVSVVAPTNTEPVAAAQSPAPVKKDEVEEPVRAKPVEPSSPPDRRPLPAQRILPNAPDFLVTDPAGYSHRLEEYRGHVVVIAVWNSDQSESISSIERLYQAYAANPKVRFLGVSNQARLKPPNTTFPVLYNEGSKLLGTQPGDFVLLDENGAVELRGSLVRDFDVITKALRGK